MGLNTISDFISALLGNQMPVHYICEGQISAHNSSAVMFFRVLL